MDEKERKKRRKRNRDIESQQVGGQNVEQSIRRMKSTSKRKRIMSIYKQLVRGNILQWNTKGEIVVKGKTYKGSNILKLLKLAVSNSGKKLPGRSAFYKVLSKLNVPQSSDSNRTELNSSRKWRPPGKLE